MRGLVVSALLLLGSFPPGLSADDEYTIGSLYPDVYPNDGRWDAGSSTNPLTLNRGGRPAAVIRPSVPDLYPGDGRFEAGSPSNPYSVQWCTWPNC